MGDFLKRKRKHLNNVKTFVCNIFLFLNAKCISVKKLPNVPILSIINQVIINRVHAQKKFITLKKNAILLSTECRIINDTFIPTFTLVNINIIYC